ncbi:MAG: YraN family protein [Saccharospirillaceae bacterium]|nr:YraN family protein [Pseudomonadales bacterium]NRB80117.1 YraN family protein [Saccharospirillaceae bacterium]
MILLNSFKKYWPFFNQSSGAQSELIALKYLSKQGLKLKKSNFSCKMGEIDLIMWDKDVLTFIEVKMRSTNDYGGALMSVTFKKQQRIKKAALFYLKQYKSNPPQCRFDVVAIDGNQSKKAQKFKYNKKTYELTWVKQAFY